MVHIPYMGIIAVRKYDGNFGVHSVPKELGQPTRKPS